MVATVAVRTVPGGRLTGLRTGGRLVTTIAGTSLIITAEKRADGATVGPWSGTSPRQHPRPLGRGCCRAGRSSGAPA
ncbi:hypothetical protein ACQPXT_01665 [Streptomyces sp. CA-100214]